MSRYIVRLLNLHRFCFGVRIEHSGYLSSTVVRQKGSGGSFGGDQTWSYNVANAGHSHRSNIMLLCVPCTC